MDFQRWSWRHFSLTPDLKSCEGKDLSCSNSLLERIGEPDMLAAQDTGDVTKPCLFSCNFQSESVTVTSSVYPNKALFPLRKDVCIVLQKLARLCAKPFGRSVFEASLDNQKVTVIKHSLILVQTMWGEGG